ncbi:MAG: hypothetical protein PF517_00130 [Salinivirgaceae bacterium]|jgi:hypothetical protein|nr:hypothetical protein [Salinivirgaceae bacterium]
MKPQKILYFLVLIASLAAGIALLFPKNGIAIGDNITLNFHWSPKNLVQKDIQYADISEIIDENQALVTEDSIDLEELIEDKIDTIRAVAKKLNAKIYPIEYPSGDTSILNGFFSKLSQSRKKRVRILHYGDSQIEGDRITGYLRNRFQKQFGGSGPGLVPALPARAESASIIHSATKNWQIHAVYYKKDTILPHRKFGVLGSFGRFTNYKDDSLGLEKQSQSASIEFNRSGMAYSSVNKFTKCRVFYGHSNENTIVKGFVNDSLIWFDALDTTQNTQRIQWDFDFVPKDFRIEFEGVKSPDIYGIALDASAGIAVDNLPFRGSSGTEFTKIEYKQFKRMGSFLNSGLIILEFGVNVVPHQVKNYNFYERALTRQIKYLQYVFPQTSILIIGLSDMSRRKGNYYESYPNIEKIRDAQRNAAKNTNCAFWDMYAAMGGVNSMPSWVFAQPPLAGKDFTHFNRRGGHIIAQMLYNALIMEYQKYGKTKDNQSLSINK